MIKKTATKVAGAQLLQSLKEPARPAPAGQQDPTRQGTVLKRVRIRLVADDFAEAVIEEPGYGFEIVQGLDGHFTRISDDDGSNWKAMGAPDVTVVPAVGGDTGVFDKLSSHAISTRTNELFQGRVYPVAFSRLRIYVRQSNASITDGEMILWVRIYQAQFQPAAVSLPGSRGEPCMDVWAGKVIALGLAGVDTLLYDDAHPDEWEIALVDDPLAGNSAPWANVDTARGIGLDYRKGLHYSAKRRMQGYIMLHHETAELQVHLWAGYASGNTWIPWRTFPGATYTGPDAVRRDIVYLTADGTSTGRPLEVPPNLRISAEQDLAETPSVICFLSFYPMS